MDRALRALYDGERKAGLGAIHQYFPSSVVKVMQQDAFERDVNLVDTLRQPEG
jgi:hypothetical protein